MAHIRRRPKLLHNKLLAIRQFLNIGQVEMASKLQSDILSDSGRHYPIKPGRISDYENGKREPNLFVLMAYAHLGKVHLESAVDDDVKVETFRSRLGQEFDYSRLLRRRKDTSNNPQPPLDRSAKPRENPRTNKAVLDKIQLPINLDLLVCKYCKKQIYTAGGSTGYLHVNSGVAECAAPQIEDLANRATPYDDNTTYVAYRAEIITDMTNRIFSYAEARSPKELLEMILADVRHFADINGLVFDEHLRLSYQIYLENKSDAPWLLLSPYAKHWDAPVS
jgi:hypothetical protein